MGDGKDVLFWGDIWLGEVPLRLLFPKLYEYSSNKIDTISDYFDLGEWKVDFCRPLDQDELV